MFTNDNVHDKSKIKFKSGLAHGLSWIGLAAPTIPWLRATVSSLLAILDTRRWDMAGLTVKLRDGDRYAFCVKYIFETMDDDRDAALVFYGMQPMLFDGTQRTVSLAGWLYDMESIFRICHIEAHLQVLLATRCLAVEARVWWMTIGEPAMQGGTWVDFRALITVRYGLLPNEDANMPARDPEIYNNMYHWRFLVMLQFGTRTRTSRWALLLIREGLPPNIRPFVPEPIVGMTLEGMIEAIMEAEIIVQGIQAAVPEEDQVVPVYDADITEAGADNDVMDPADIPVDPEDHPEDPPIIIIESDDEEEDFDDLEEPEEDPEEILFDHADWDADSDFSSHISIA
ncbi:hypothetical protein TIFTF001_037735 [Ficus carica]|uniref:Uncharacterized protein n=1 Tax=Ficus carica TaxID=3494 RepID=A0AA88E659_FICCA|nr:hypothetical protein TIFTF001_037735 [Ficus carica]